MGPQKKITETGLYVSSVYIMECMQ